MIYLYSAIHDDETSDYPLWSFHDDDDCAFIALTIENTRRFDVPFDMPDLFRTWKSLKMTV